MMELQKVPAILMPSGRGSAEDDHRGCKFASRVRLIHRVSSVCPISSFSGVRCPDSEHLAAFVDGRLSKAELLAIAEHLSYCDPCYETFSEAVRFRWGETGRSDHRPRRWRWILLWLAGAVVLATILLSFL